MSNFIKNIFVRLKFPRDLGPSTLTSTVESNPLNPPSVASQVPVVNSAVPPTTQMNGKLEITTSPFRLRSSLWLFLCILMLTGAGVGSYFILSGKNRSYFQRSISPLSVSIFASPSPSPTPSPISIPTASVQPTTKTSPTPAPSVTRKTIHLYPTYGVDPNTQINKIHIISLLFVPKDIDTSVKNEWFTNMEKIDSKIKSFFEKQFAYNIELTYKIVPQPIKGRLNISEYTPDTLAVEAREQTNNLIETNSHNIWMIYLVRDSEYKKNIIGGNLGGLPSLQAATQFEFWLDNDAINYSDQYGLEGSAHEFAHALGIPHPWDLPSNTNHDPNYGNVPGDLMGYSNNGLSLDSLYIRDDIKKEMGL